MASSSVTKGRESVGFDVFGTFVFFYFAFTSAVFLGAKWGFIGYGIGLLLSILIVGPFTTGYFNLALVSAERTVGNATGARLSKDLASELTAGEVLAVSLAALASFLTTKTVPIISVTLGVPLYCAFAVEVIVSTVFSSVVSLSATGKMGPAKGPLVATVLALGIAAASKTSGGALNPLRAIGPLVAYVIIALIVRNNFEHLGLAYLVQFILVYLLAPSIGAQIGYRLMRAWTK